MLKAIVYSLLILSSFQGLSQNKSIDSLVNLLDIQKIDSNKYSLCLKIAKAYADSSYDKSLLYFNKALDIADRSSDRKKIAHIYHQIGYMYQRKGEFQLALDNYNNALTINKYLHSKKGIGQTLNDIGLIYKTWGKYDKALENYIDALYLFDEISDEENSAIVANNIGQIYFYRNEFEKAIEYFKRYLEVNKKGNNIRAVAGATNNIGSAYMELNKYDDALLYFTTSMRIYDSLDLKIGVAVIKDNIGSLFLRKGNYSEALSYHVDALRIFEEMKSQSRICNSLQNIGLVYSKLKKPELAVNYLNKSLDLAISLNQKETQKEVCEALADVYQEIKQFDKALLYYKRYFQIKDSLLNAETVGKIETLQADYEAHKKEKELADINQKLQIQKNIFFLAAGAIILFIFLLVLILRENNRKKKIIKKTHQQSDILIETLKGTSRSFTKLLNQNCDLSSFFSKTWVTKPSYQQKDDNRFIFFKKDSESYLAFISSTNPDHNVDLANLSVFEFFGSFDHIDNHNSLHGLYKSFIINNSLWSSVLGNINSIKIDFLIYDKNRIKFNSGLGEVLFIHENKLKKLNSEWQDISKDDRLFYCSIINNSGETIEHERILTVLEKNLSASISKSFDEQEEILKSCLDLLINEYESKFLVSVSAFLV